MKKHWLRLLKGVGLISAAAVVVSFLPTLPASADSMPPDASDPTTPVSVSADALPTAQINGVAWAQKVIGNTVYVGGSFTTARPAGSAPGVNTVTRSNLLAYNLTTGALISSWAPSTNGTVLAIAASPDNSRLYIGGQFTSVNGQTRNRVAALDPTTGAVVGSFRPNADASVYAIAASNSTVYFGGLLSQVNGIARSKVAAVQASDGSLLSWAPDAEGGRVKALVLSPDGSKIAIGGQFTSINGSSNPGYGLALVSPTTGALLPTPANSLVRDGGDNAGIYSLSSDGDSLYAAGFVFGDGGNLEGITRIAWNDGSIKWVEDCHGDTYSSYPMGGLIYAASHAHYCGNLPDGFPQTDPWTFHHATAFTKAVTGTLGGNTLGYYNFQGNPSPSLSKWLPLLTNGTYTGQNQAAWSVDGNDKYVVYGGEFPTAGGGAQQGLVRYAVPSIAPNKVGPEYSQSKINPKLSSFARGTVRLTWQADWDRDNEKLTYQVIRNSDTAHPVYTVTQLSSEWTRPAMGYLDKDLVPGQTYRYRLFVTDPYGNQARSDTVTITASSDGTISDYAQGVLDDHPESYWRLGESSGTNVVDWAGFNDQTAGSGVTRGADGAINGDSNPASTFDGTGNGMAAATSSETAPNTFSSEAWFKTGATTGGKIIGFGDQQTGNSSSYDRQVYMSDNGQLTFGVYPGGVAVVTSSKSYNDGQWHQVVATLGSNGMVLWVDGLKVASRTDVTTAQPFDGYWRIGGDNLNGWPGQPSDFYFSGSIDDVAVYPTVLTSTQVRAHFTNSGRTLPGTTVPSDAYGKAVYTDEPDFYWRLGEQNGPTANDTTSNQASGIYSGGVTYGGPSGVGASGDRSVTLNGSDGAVVTSGSYTNPSVYAEELWFKTATTSGGKLIGFGSAQTGLSSNYDRHVYMLNDGQLRFGTYTGQTNVIDSGQSYNDNAWHYLVAEQGPDGMKMYVDNQLVGTNPQTAAQNYTGYWRVGGDNTWGGADSNYFAGSIDDVAVYSKVLGSSDIADHFVKGGGQLPNQAPTAAFTSSVNKLVVGFDGSGSKDTDGTVKSYAWDFGDNTAAGSGVSPNHTYAAAGDYQVKLTVTDDGGATDSVTHTVTAVAAPANQAPTAAFTSSVNNLAVGFDGSGSKDTDGTVKSYAWDFGDNTAAGSGVSPNHTYAAAGDYQVKLTVTDDGGATDSVTHTVTAVAAPANQAPTAAFTSSVNNLAVGFDGSGSKDTDGTVKSYAWDFGDNTAAGSGVSPNHTYAAAGDYQVKLTVTDDGGATDSVSHTVTAVAAPANGPIASDDFGRSVASGWGSAVDGGAWTNYGSSSYFSVSGGTGQIKLTSAGAGPRIALDSVSSTDSDISVSIAMDKLADQGGAYVSVGGRTIGSSDYRAKVKVNPNGRMTLYLTKVVSNAETTLTSVNLPSSMTYEAGKQLNLRLQVFGTSPTTVRARVWTAGTSEPSSWQATTTDSTAALQKAGGVGIVGYLAGSATNAPITLSADDLLVKPVQ